MAGSNWGYIPDGYDAGDQMYKYNGELRSKNDLRSANLLKAAPEAFKTEPTPTGSCVVDAVVAAVRYLAHHTKDSKIPREPSRRFIYYNARALPLMDKAGDPMQWPEAVEDTGVRIRHAVQGVSIYGAAPEIWFPWAEQDLRGGGGRAIVGINDRPNFAAYDEASNTTPAIESCRLDPDQPDNSEELLEPEEKRAIGLVTLSNLKQCLSEGFPVVFAFCFFWDTFQTVPPSTSGDDGYPTIAMIPPGRRQVGPDPEKKYRTHVGLAIAFDQEKRRVLVKSMWNENSIPYFWMSFEWITDFRATENFWMMRSLDKAASRRTMKKPTDGDFVPEHFQYRGWTIARIRETYKLSMAPNSTIATVSRQSNLHGWNIEMTDIFWITVDGNIERSYYYDSMGPQNGFHWSLLCTPPKRVPNPVTAAQGCIAAIEPFPDRLDIFWLTQDGSVCHGYCNNATKPEETITRPSSFRDWDWNFDVIAPAGSAQPGAGLVATRRDKGHQGIVQLYWVGPNGSIENANNTVELYAWALYHVAGPGSATPLSNLAATATGPEYAAGIWNETIWWIAPDGMVEGRWAANNRGWQEMYTKNLPPCTAALGSRLSAVIAPGEVDVFYITPTGKVRVRRYGMDLNDEEAFSGSLARVDSEIKAYAVHSYLPRDYPTIFWVSPNGSLMKGSRAGPKDWAAYVFSKPGCVMGGTPISVSKYKGSFQICCRLYDSQLGRGRFSSP